MRHQLEIDIRAAFSNVQEFRAKFETDKHLREAWRQETGENLDMAIEIEETGGYRFQQSAIESRIIKGKRKLEAVLESHVEEEDDDDVETDRGTGNWGGPRYKSVSDVHAEKAKEKEEDQEDDWSPGEADKVGEGDDLPMFGKPEDEKKKE